MAIEDSEGLETEGFSRVDAVQEMVAAARAPAALGQAVRQAPEAARRLLLHALALYTGSQGVTDREAEDRHCQWPGQIAELHRKIPGRAGQQLERSHTTRP